MSYYRIDGKYIDTQKTTKIIEKFSLSDFNKKPSTPSETDKEKMIRKAKEYAKKEKAAREYAEKNAPIKEVKKCFSMEIDKPKIKPKPTPTPKPKPKEENLPEIYSTKSVTKFIKENKNIQFYDIKKNPVTLTISKNNNICLTKLDRTVCIANNRFSINAAPIRVADIEKGDTIIPYRKKPSPPIYIKPKPKPAVPYRNPNKPLSKFMRKYGTVIY